MDNANTATPCELIAWALQSATRRSLIVAHLRRVAQVDLDYSNSTAHPQARQIAQGRACDLFSDALLVNAGREPETFTGRLNALDWAAGSAALDSNARATLFDRGQVMPAA